MTVTGHKLYSTLLNYKLIRYNNYAVSAVCICIYTIIHSIVSLQVLSMTNNPLIMSAVNTAYLQLLPSLRKLDLSHLVEPLVHLPESFATLTNLSEIDLRGVKFPNISAEFFSPLAEIDLVKLDLSQSEIQEVDVDAFTPLCHLSELILSKSSVTTQILENILYGLDNSSIRILHLNEVFSHTGHNHTVTKHMFRHLNSSKLKVLHFGGNNAGLHGKLPARLFQPLKFLRELHVDNCGLLSVSVDAFHGLHHLLMLNMTKNSLTCNGENDCQFLSTGFSLKLLQTLDLSNNHITDSGHYNFSNATFPSLINLNLTKNKLQSIPTGLFGNLPKLSLLDMSENPIEEIAENALAELSSLATLHIENCPSLSRIKERSFNGLGGLKVLNLQNSGIVHIHHAALAHFSHLEWLYLKNNRLGESESSIDRLTLKKSVLKVLDLSDNYLNVLPMGILHNSHSLTWLIVNNNRLFNCTQFHPLFGSNITTLDASYNQFAQPTVACFEGMEKLEYLNLAGNPFVCSCELKPFTEWLVAKKIATEQNDEYVCVAPDSNSGKKMLRVSYSNWTCYRKYTMMTSLLVITLIAIFVCFTFLVVRRFRRESSNGCRMFSSCESNSSEEGTRSLNDSTPTDSCTPYSPLEEEGSPEMENTRAVQQNNPNGHSHRCADYNVVEDPECNGILFSPDRLSENGKINKTGVTRKKSRRTREQNTPNQSRAFTSDTSSKSIRSGTGRVVDPDAMLLTSHLDNSSVDTHLEDAV